MKKIFGVSLVLMAVLFLSGCEPKPPVERPPEMPSGGVTERPPEEPDPAKWAQYMTADWKTYSHQKDGWQVKYPTDFSVEELDPADVIGKDGGKIKMLSGTVFYSTSRENDRISVEKYSDVKILNELGVKTDQADVRFGDNNYQKFTRFGEGDGYGYVIKKGNIYYAFSATIGPDNQNFDNLMQTVKFN